MPSILPSRESCTYSRLFWSTWSTHKKQRFKTNFFLDFSSRNLQATLLNSYLVQLLDNGFLHADPHPGNFLLQDDGTLCVLDFGLMTEVP